ncbi:MAG: glycoside hydrolase [Lachnospiraceae bacterium]|nr:glycoside hydrolase [Lachnospiraceae bacterium]
MYRIETPKDLRKGIRSILQLSVLLFVLYILIRVFVTFNEYRPYNANDKNVVSGKDHGFVALSYIGTDREGNQTLISSERLSEHFKAMHDLGYVTVTQKDVEDYYNEGRPLPDKALFLMYEDGRKDTAIYAQSVMENYNYKATMFTYAEKFRSRDGHFLMPKDLEDLVNNGYWEIGSNGYRLGYINVFDRYHRYIGQLNSTEYSDMVRFLGRDYNHFLMDYIRDENDIPIESVDAMRRRISGEYDLMKNEYTQLLGYVPKAYVLMHANTGAFGENRRVSAVNEQCIADTFDMNFNREGYSWNNKESSIYDLTRMQPQAYWYTNHLLMRIKYDIDETDAESITFVEGDTSQKQFWECEKGAVEFKPQLIALTSLPEDEGVLRFKAKTDLGNVAVSTYFTGNVIGSQAVELHANKDRSKMISVEYMNNVMYLKQNGEILEQIDMDDFDELEKISVEEDKRDTLVGEYEAFARRAGSHNESVEYKKLKAQAQALEARSVREGAKEYKRTFQISDPGNRKIDITLKDNRITVYVDDKPMWEKYELTESDPGDICLSCAWGDFRYSQRNIADDVYDGVFSEVVIRDPDTDTEIYSNLYKGKEKATNALTGFWDSLINWFIKNL